MAAPEAAGEIARMERVTDTPRPTTAAETAPKADPTVYKSSSLTMTLPDERWLERFLHISGSCGLSSCMQQAWTHDGRARRPYKNRCRNCQHRQPLSSSSQHRYQYLAIRFVSLYCCFTYLEQSATSRHFSTISADFPKKRLKPFLFSHSFPS